MGRGLAPSWQEDWVNALPAAVIYGGDEGISKATGRDKQQHEITASGRNQFRIENKE